jgi:hypothetical protein
MVSLFCAPDIPGAKVPQATMNAKAVTLRAENEWLFFVAFESKFCSS